MKNVNGFWLPDGETHLVPFLEGGPRFAGGPTYQLHKFQACVPYIKNFRAAIDIGAHCGLWSRVLGYCFEHVLAFEPMEAHRDCFNLNVMDCPALIDLDPRALSNKEQSLRFAVDNESSGDTHVRSEYGCGPEVFATTLDLRIKDAEALDFVKIDCEGYEYFILQGAERVIREFKPCIIVEQKPKKGSRYGIADDAAAQLLKSWGAKQRAIISGDYIFNW